MLMVALESVATITGAYFAPSTFHKKFKSQNFENYYYFILSNLKF